MTEGEDNEDDDDVVPLDFRTALLEDENKVVIQAKPLNLKTEEELMREATINMDFENRDSRQQFESMDSYLEAVKKQPFNVDDGNVILIDPDIKIKEKFEQIDLPCNTEQRINNTFNAPIRTKEQIALAAYTLHIATQQSKMQAPKLASK